MSNPIQQISTGINTGIKYDCLESSCVSLGWILPLQIREFDVTEVFKSANKKMGGITIGTNRYDDQDRFWSHCVSPGWMLPHQMKKFVVMEVLKAQNFARKLETFWLEPTGKKQDYLWSHCVSSGWEKEIKKFVVMEVLKAQNWQENGWHKSLHLCATDLFAPKIPLSSFNFLWELCLTLHICFRQSNAALSGVQHHLSDVRSVACSHFHVTLCFCCYYFNMMLVEFSAHVINLPYLFSSSLMECFLVFPFQFQAARYRQHGAQRPDDNHVQRFDLRKLAPTSLLILHRCFGRRLLQYGWEMGEIYYIGPRRNETRIPENCGLRSAFLCRVSGVSVHWLRTLVLVVDSDPLVVRRSGALPAHRRIFPPLALVPPDKSAISSTLHGYVPKIVV